MIYKAVFVRYTAALSAFLLKAGPIWFLCGEALSDPVEVPANAEALLDFPRLPAASLDPTDRYILMVHEEGLLPTEYLQQPNVTVAGVRVDLNTGGPFAPIAYFALTLVDRETGAQNRIELPADITIGYPQWSPDGSHFLFTVTSRRSVELWVGDAASGTARRLIETPLNAIRGAPCNWMPNSVDVLCRLVVEDRALSPDAILESSALPSRSELNFDVLDQQMIDYYLRSQLEVISTNSGARKAVGEPHVLDSTEPAPDGQSILVTRRIPEPSESAAVGQWRKVTEVWDLNGRVLHSFPTSRPGDADTVRAVHWRAAVPATVIWVENDDGAESVLQQAVPFLEPPAEIYRTPHRFAGIEWLDESNLAIVSEFDSSNRITSAVLVDATNSGESPRRIWSRNVDIADAEYRNAVSRRNGDGQPVVRVRDNAIYAAGRAGQQSFLERVQLDSLTVDRIWESDGLDFETVVDVLGPNGDVLLTRHENAEEPPNYFLLDLDTDTANPLTNRKHPAPELSNTQRIALRYQRADGLALSSTLYIPPGRLPDEKLPLLVWAYPKRYGAGGSPMPADERERFPTSEQAFKLFFVSRGYAVLDDVSMPVIGSAETANDTFLEQIIANAQAAVAAAVDTGTVDSGRVGIAGHSYGAFMAANLLAHTRIFAAGVAMSGAYNRTLTPFGFQTERRTLWEARDTYLEMSPLLYSDQIQAPLLLIHGLLDDNTGTPPIHSTKFYEAIRHNGGDTALLLLPFEGHSYRSRDSVLRVATETLNWFDTHLSSDARRTSSRSSTPVTTR